MKGATAFLAAAAAMANAAATPAHIEARASSSGSTPVVTVKGNAFFAGNNRFYIRGVDYQPGGSSDAKDPIADVAGCKRDIEYFKKLGINTIRVYTVDNSANHDECMAALSDAGIYLALDVNTPKYSINRAKPGPSYNAVYLQSVFATIDAFVKYDNTLLFFSGNEVINDDMTTDCAPYVKAVTRDMRQYIRNRSYRHVPVGYSAADVESNRYEMAQYMNCGTDDERSDFYAFNDYSWCDPSSFTTSGWDQKVQKFSNYSIPLFLSEYGCNTNARTFGAVESIYSTQMSAVYSGGLVYEYSQEESNYGLVEIDGSTVTPRPDFQNLMSEFAKTSNPSGDGGYSSSGAASTCPASSSTWQLKDFSGSALPAIPDGAKKYMTSGAGTGPGLAGDGSQDAGGASTGTAAPNSGQPSITGTDNAAATGTDTGAGSAVRVNRMNLLAPFMCIGAVFVSTLLGASLL